MRAIHTNGGPVICWRKTRRNLQSANCAALKVRSFFNAIAFNWKQNLQATHARGFRICV
jgi:hypothetical protein